ncbi:MAG: efflux RND transporter periplasmic adaptor subunit [Desulfobacteraceae bacterium]|nr:efflux RND transporter periplasmic adaptor subunit [Desulfobacteraceae bacterium]
MRQLLYPKIRIVLIILPVAAAVAVVAYLVMHRPGPEKETEAESVRVLRVIEAPVADLVPRATGYGVAEPGQVWEAVAEVKGTVVEMHPQLDSGEIIEAESILVKIDPTEYELTVARLEAGIEEIRAKISELNQEEKNTKRLLAIERRSLNLARKSLERQRAAMEREAIAPDQVDREERNFLQQQQKVRQLENTLSLIPAKRKSLKASLAVNQAKLDQAETDLAKTTIRAPFDCRLSNVNLETGQFVRAGQSLFKAHGTAVTEVEARFRTEQLRNLLDTDKRSRFQPGMRTDTFRQLFQNVGAVVRLQNGNWSADWNARVDRVRETMDAKTREMRVVAAVDRPYEKAQPGVRPPLTAGMFCELTLSGPIQPKKVVLPRTAVHQGTVFTVDHQQRLRKKQVTVDFVQSDFVVLKSGLSGGEKVVVSDPSPAITGMKVSTTADESLREHLLNISQAKEAH